MAPKPLAKSLERLAEKTERRFHDDTSLKSKMDGNLEDLKQLSNEWVRDGLVE